MRLLLVIFIGIVALGLEARDNSLVSVRSMGLGSLLVIKKTESNWVLDEVIPTGYILKQFPFGAVQFKHSKNPSKCLIVNQLWIETGACYGEKQDDTRMLFSLLPTSTGAFQIQSFANGNCLMSEIVPGDTSKSPSKHKISLRECYSNPQSSIPLSYLWVFTPAVKAAKTAKQ